MFGLFIRWAIVVLLGLATAWPEWGIAARSWAWFQYAPIPIVLFDLVWAVILSIALPLTLRVFRVVSTVALLALMLTLLYLAYTRAPDVLLSMPWPVVWGVLVLSSSLGWWKIATPIWRWSNGIVAVQQTTDHVAHGGN